MQVLLANVLLSHSLVVGLAFGLRSSGALGREHQNYEGDEVRKQPVEVGADSYLRQFEHPVAVYIQRAVACAYALEESE